MDHAAGGPEEALGALAAREADLARRNQELAALVEATRVIASSLDLEEILQAIVHQAAAISGTPFVRLFLVDDGAQALRYRVGVGLPPEAERALAVPVGESFSGQVAATGKPLAVADTRGDPRLRHPEHATQHGLISYLGLPVKLGDRVLGVLVFNTRSPRTYSQAEIAFLSAFADHAAIAIENARLHGMALRRGEQMAALLRATRSVMAGLDLRQTLDRILAEAARISGCSHVKVLLVDRETGTLRAGALQGTGMLPVDRLPLGKGLSGIVAATGQALFSEDCPHDPRNVYADQDRQLGIVTYLGLPIKIRDEVAGVLSFNTTAPHQYSPEELEYLSAFADQASSAIQNAWLYEATVKRERQVAILNDATRALTRTLDPARVVHEILGSVLALIPGVAVRLWERAGEADPLRLTASIGVRDPEGGVGRSFPLGQGLVGIAMASREPVISLDVRSDPRFVNRAWAEAEGLVSCIVLPLIHFDRFHGVLAVFTRTPHTFSADEVSLLRSLAAGAAIALENARLHTEVRRHAAELEARVRRRTAELEEALRVKVDFLGKMSHELRTPLNFIIGFSDLLRQGMGGPLTPKQATYVDRIHGGGMRLLGLFNDLLDIAQMDAGKSRLSLEPVIVGPLVQEVLGSVQVQAGQKRLKVTTTLDPWVPFIVADRFKLAQILHNLVGNAVKFTPEGGSIRLTIRRLTEDRRPEPESVPRHPSSVGWVEIVVEDTGIGIRPENLEAIFGAFYQVDSSDIRVHGGAGLGLTLVRKLVELHGGRVWAESAGPEQGARFIVRIPPLEVPKAKKILLVEDEALIRIQMVSALESAGFSVVQAETGAEALTAMEAVAPDLMILDILLPDMEGWEILRRVRDGEEVRTLPVLVVSGLENVNVALAQARGADDFLTKPISPRVLVDTVVRLLGQVATAPAGAGAEAPGG